MHHEQMAEDRVVDSEGALDRGDLAAVEAEHDEDVVAVAEALDLVGQPSLAPERRLHDLAALRLDQAAHRFRRSAQRILVQLRPDDVHQLVVTQHARHTSFPLALRHLAPVAAEVVETGDRRVQESYSNVSTRTAGRRSVPAGRVSPGETPWAAA